MLAVNLCSTSDSAVTAFEIDRDLVAELLQTAPGNLTIVEGELRDIDDALRRLDDGTYGICEECGKPIDEARLEAVPWARYCVVDQARVERALSRR